MKTKNLVTLAVAALVVVLLTVLCLTGIQVGKYIVIPAADGITRGNDFAKGTYVVLNVNEPAAEEEAAEPTEETAEEAAEEEAVPAVPASEELYQQAISAMKKRAELLTMDVVVMEQGESSIRIEMPTVNYEDASGVLYTLTQPCHVYLTNAEGETVLEGKDIASYAMSADSTGTVYYISIKVEEEALSAWAAMTVDVNEAITVYVDGAAVATAPASQILSSGMSFTDYGTAATVMMALETGEIEAALATVSSGNIPASMTEKQFDSAMFAIALAVAVAAVVMIVVYKGMGVVSALSIVLSAVAVVYFYGLVPYIPFGMLGFFGFASAMGVKLLCDIDLLSKTTALMSGSDLTGVEAVKLAWRESGKNTLEICGVAIIAALVLQYFGGAAVSAFTNVFAIGSLIVLVVTAVVTRPLVGCVVDKAAKTSK